jgi:ribonuclease-3
MTTRYQTALAHNFERPDLLREALTHRSALRPNARGVGSNERLEFIGDRVLGLLIAEWLIERFPGEREGDLGRRLSHLVSQPVLAKIAEDIGLDEALEVSPGEARAGVRQRATVLSDALEATLGALFLDGGINVARRFLRAAWRDAIAEQRDPPKDAKTRLQEWALAAGLTLPAYAVADRSGPSHDPRFTISVTVGGHVARGEAGSKRAAEQRAAETLLRLVTP